MLEAGPTLKSYAQRGVPLYITHTGMNQPWVIVAMGAGIEPKEWLGAEKRIVPGAFEEVARFGLYHFIVDQATIDELKALSADRQPDRVVFVVRPGEWGLSKPVHRVLSPTGEEMLWICEETL
ncbi:MAG: hypothetical protein IPJ04_18420 [Candidatus Eisenbacteria bacterium]|nr:hypothetical protein [Candidatus Eisenbacteria bacterium]